MAFCQSVFKVCPLEDVRIAVEGVFLFDSRSLQMTIFPSWIECKFESWSEKSLHHTTHTYRKMRHVQMHLFGKVLGNMPWLTGLLCWMISTSDLPNKWRRQLFNKRTDSALCACITSTFVVIHLMGVLLKNSWYTCHVDLFVLFHLSETETSLL